MVQRDAHRHSVRGCLRMISHFVWVDAIPQPTARIHSPPHTHTSHSRTPQSTIHNPQSTFQNPTIHNPHSRTPQSTIHNPESTSTIHTQHPAWATSNIPRRKGNLKTPNTSWLETRHGKQSRGNLHSSFEHLGIYTCLDHTSTAGGRGGGDCGAGGWRSHTPPRNPSTFAGANTFSR
jgi:hypothetical protein